MKQVTALRIVVASPSDVQAERDTLPSVIEELNRGIAGANDLRLEVTRWERDAYPGFHTDGPQGLIDPILRIEDCDVFIGIFWKRFGTPMKGAQSGTEHEFQRAYRTWQENGSPHIMFYFKQEPYSPTSREETEQWGRVLDFQRSFPREGLWWRYSSELEFERLVREHLTKFILNKTKENAENVEDNDNGSEDDEQDSIYDEDVPLEGCRHAIYPCELEAGDKINIDLKSEDPLDVMIMDQDDYRAWERKKYVDTSYGHYEDRQHLHSFFTALEDGEYLVVICNKSKYEVEAHVEISFSE